MESAKKPLKACRKSALLIPPSTNQPIALSIWLIISIPALCEVSISLPNRLISGLVVFSIIESISTAHLITR